MTFFRSARRASSSDEPPRRRRWRSWVLGALSGVSGLVVLVATALVAVLHGLDRPWIKHQLQRMARSSAGVEIDYVAARVDVLSGAQVVGFVLQSPAEVRRFAPELVRIGRIDVRWSPRSLLGGGNPLLERVSAADVAATLVVDEHGRTSLDAFPPSPPSPPVPLSRLASKFLASAPPVRQLDVAPITLALVRTQGGAIVDHTELRGLSVALSAGKAEAPPGGWRVTAGLGSPATPLDLALSRDAPDAKADIARARLWTTIEATPSALSLGLDLGVSEQTFAPRVSGEPSLRIHGSARFDPAAGQTEIKVDRADLGDGVATAEASIVVFDTGNPVVRLASGDIDVARLLAWLPAGVVPVTAGRARVHCEVNSLVTGPVVHLAEGGAVDVGAELASVSVEAAPGPLRIAAGSLTFRAQPAGAGLTGKGTVKVDGVRLARGGESVAIDDLAVDVDGSQQADGALSGRVTTRFVSGEFRRGGDRGRPGTSLVARDAHAELGIQGVYPNLAQPLETRGDVGLELGVATLEVEAVGTRAIADGLTVRVHGLLQGRAPYAAEVGATASRLRALGREGDVLVDAPASLEVHAREVRPDLAHPSESGGVVDATVEVGPMQAHLQATKGADAVDFALGAAASSLAPIRPFVPLSLVDRVPWERVHVAVRSAGRVEALGGANPTVREATEVDVEGPAFDAVTARSLVVSVKSQGNALRHQADIEVHAPGLAFDGGSPSDDSMTLSASMDRERPSFSFKLATEGRVAAKVSARASFDDSSRGLVYAIDGKVGGLAPLAPFASKLRGLRPFDLSELEVELSTHGTLLGVFAGARNGSFTLQPNPMATAAIEGTADVRVGHFRWANGDTAILTPAVVWHGDMRVAGPRRLLESRLQVGTVHLDLGSRDVDVNGISDEMSAAVVGSLLNPEAELTERLSVRAVEQNVVPQYRIGDLALALSAERGPEGVVHVSEMKVANALGGTTLATSGNIDIGEGRRTLSVNTSLSQDLARLSTVPERFSGQGRVSVEANVTSPDFARYHVRAAVKGQDVTIRLARLGIDVETANAEVPVTATLEVGDKGVVLARSERRSPYSMLRFADQHPLLSRSGFLSIARLKTPFLSIAPIVGNLEIEQNVVSLRQFEMGVRGGSITGQCGIDWDGPRSTAELHVRASGVQSSHGEPFDGNIAVAFSAADRTIDGRAEILRIGERHLLDLLDLQDPRHVDAAMNRIRFALLFGYPKSLRLIFDHGFASAHLELGGLASLVSIGEIRGIPMGPIVDKMLAPALEGKRAKEAP